MWKVIKRLLIKHKAVIIGLFLECIASEIQKPVNFRSESVPKLREVVQSLMIWGARTP